jgi:hypothetical protein
MREDHTMTTIIREPEDVRTFTQETLGFMPSESFVVLPIDGNGPVARIDLATIAEMRDSLDAARPMWNQVLVAVFSTGDLYFNAQEILPGVEVALAVVLDNAREGEITREDVEFLAVSGYTTVEDAEVAAVEAWEAGHGAQANMLLTHAMNLGDLTARGEALMVLILIAKDPRA